MPAAEMGASLTDARGPARDVAASMPAQAVAAGGRVMRGAGLLPGAGGAECSLAGYVGA
jgi:hypothetical protein